MSNVTRNEDGSVEFGDGYILTKDGGFWWRSQLGGGGLYPDYDAARELMNTEDSRALLVKAITLLDGGEDGPK